MGNDALEPCPICNSINIVRGPIECTCVRCGCSADIAVWNTRAAIQSLPEEIPGLGEAISQVTRGWNGFEPQDMTDFQWSELAKEYGPFITAARKYHELTMKRERGERGAEIMGEPITGIQDSISMAGRGGLWTWTR